MEEVAAFAQGRGSWVGVETKVVINGPRGERSSWEKEYLDSGKEWLTGLGEAIGSKEVQLGERVTWSRKEKRNWLGTVTVERGGGEAAREGSSWGKEAEEQLGLQKRLSRAVTELVCP